MQPQFMQDGQCMKNVDNEIQFGLHSNVRLIPDRFKPKLAPVSIPRCRLLIPGFIEILSVVLDIK